RPGVALHVVNHGCLELRISDLRGRPRELRVAAGHRAVARVGVQGEAAVAAQIDGLHRVEHRSDREVRTDDAYLRAADSRRAVAAQRGQDMVLRRGETRQYRRREFRFRLRELLPGSHVDSLACGTDIRAVAIAVAMSVEADWARIAGGSVGTADRLGVSEELECVGDGRTDVVRFGIHRG